MEHRTAYLQEMQRIDNLSAKVQKLNLPELRPRKEEIDAIIAIQVIAKELKKAETSMHKRIKSIPGGWRDFKMLLSVIEIFTMKLIYTLPLEKYKTLEALLPNIRYSITYHKKVGRSDDTISGIYTKDMDKLIAAAHENCKICDGNCDACALGKVFDRMLYTDREPGRSYAFMDMTEDWRNG